MNQKLDYFPKLNLGVIKSLNESDAKIFAKGIESIFKVFKASLEYSEPKCLRKSKYELHCEKVITNMPLVIRNRNYSKCIPELKFIARRFPISANPITKKVRKAELLSADAINNLKQTYGSHANFQTKIHEETFGGDDTID